MFCRNRDAPIAVINGTSRGELRSGRYAIRSSRTATVTDVMMAVRNRMKSAEMGWRSMYPLSVYAFAKK